MGTLRRWFRRNAVYQWMAGKTAEYKPIPSIPNVPSSRPELEETRRRLNNASKRVLRLIDLELEAVLREK